MGSGILTDTYVAALQHDIADVPEDVSFVGVVRRPAPWFYAQVDENLKALAPSTQLLDAVKDQHERYLDEGLEDAEAHNRAFDAVDFDRRYRDQLDTPEAREEMANLVSRLDAGEDIALVCYENTEEKRCHRTILRAVIEDRRSKRKQD